MAKETKRYDDGSFTVVETTCPEDARRLVLKFGPLSATLGNLYDIGFRLEVHGWEQRHGGFPYCNRHKVHLYSPETKERYLVAKALLGDLMGNLSLADFLRTDMQLIKRGAGREITIKPEPNTDPWLQLREKYHTTRPAMMVGNRTLAEVVRASLEEGFHNA